MQSINHVQLHQMSQNQAEMMFERHGSALSSNFPVECIDEKGMSFQLDNPESKSSMAGQFNYNESEHRGEAQVQKKLKISMQ